MAAADTHSHSFTASAGTCALYFRQLCRNSHCKDDSCSALMPPPFPFPLFAYPVPHPVVLIQVAKLPLTCWIPLVISLASPAMVLADFACEAALPRARSARPACSLAPVTRLLMSGSLLMASSASLLLSSTCRLDSDKTQTAAVRSHRKKTFPPGQAWGPWTNEWTNGNRTTLVVSRRLVPPELLVHRRTALGTETRREKGVYIHMGQKLIRLGLKQSFPGNWVDRMFQWKLLWHHQ